MIVRSEHKPNKSMAPPPPRPRLSNWTCPKNINKPPPNYEMKIICEKKKEKRNSMIFYSKKKRGGGQRIFVVVFKHIKLEEILVVSSLMSLLYLLYNIHNEFSFICLNWKSHARYYYIAVFFRIFVFFTPHFFFFRPSLILIWYVSAWIIDKSTHHPSPPAPVNCFIFFVCRFFFLFRCHFVHIWMSLLLCMPIHYWSTFQKQVFKKHRFFFFFQNF